MGYDRANQRTCSGGLADFISWSTNVIWEAGFGAYVLAILGSISLGVATSPVPAVYIQSDIHRAGRNRGVQ